MTSVTGEVVNTQIIRLTDRLTDQNKLNDAYQHYRSQCLVDLAQFTMKCDSQHFRSARSECCALVLGTTKQLHKKRLKRTNTSHLYQDLFKTILILCIFPLLTLRYYVACSALVYHTTQQNISLKRPCLEDCLLPLGVVQTHLLGHAETS